MLSGSAPADMAGRWGPPHARTLIVASVLPEKSKPLATVRHMTEAV